MVWMDYSKLVQCRVSAQKGYLGIDWVDNTASNVKAFKADSIQAECLDLWDSLVFLTVTTRYPPAPVV